MKNISFSIKSFLFVSLLSTSLLLGTLSTVSAAVAVPTVVTQRGCPQVISMDLYQTDSKGYLVNDSTATSGYAFNELDLWHLLNFLQYHFLHKGEPSLERAFTKWMLPGDKTVENKPQAPSRTSRRNSDFGPLRFQSLSTLTRVPSVNRKPTMSIASAVACSL